MSDPTYYHPSQVIFKPGDFVISNNNIGRKLGRIKYAFGNEDRCFVVYDCNDWDNYTKYAATSVPNDSLIKVKPVKKDMDLDNLIINNLVLYEREGVYWIEDKPPDFENFYY